MKRLITLLAAMIMSSALYGQQFLPLEGIVNVRDLGGYPVGDGGRVRGGVLLRSAHLAYASDLDIQYLSSLPLRKVIDLRKDNEMIGKEDRPVPGAEYVSLPIDASGNVSAQASEKEKRKFKQNGKEFDVKKIIVMLAFNKKAQAVARDLYTTLLFYPDCQQQFAQMFREILSTGSGAVLYHCTQGKDRTGIASALILAALGADRETIVEDFDATNRVYEEDVQKYSRRVRLLGGKDRQLAVVKSFLGANTDNFVKALDEIDARYGSMDAYLKGPIGLTEEDILTLRERYLSPR